MLAGLSRSTDGGVNFASIGIAHCCVNAVRLAAPSASVAVLAPSVSGRPTFLRTTDGGQSWSAVQSPSAVSVFSLEFTDERNGFALVQLAGNRQALWRTTDGGASWNAVVVR
jgi:photosystem II stability/assembly factor-like uncharacterized protein